MLGTHNVFNALIINILLGTAWHCASLFMCTVIDLNRFSPDKRIYRPHRWEKDGRFYSEVMHINKWKDRLPQHVGKNGFSKSHLDSLSPEYIDRFIAETCRGEWNHKVNCLFALVLLSINKFYLGLLLSILLISGNLPFICIQRYNRLRLQKLRSMIVRRSQRHTAPDPSEDTAAADKKREENTVSEK